MLNNVVCDALGRILWYEEDGDSYVLTRTSSFAAGTWGSIDSSQVAGYELTPTAMQNNVDTGTLTYGGNKWVWDNDANVYVGPTLQPLQRPLYSHEYTYGNFITNGERNQDNNMKAAYITVGGAVQLFKENTTAGKWVTVPNDNNLALMDAPLTAFESGPPSDFQYHGFVFTFSAGDVDGYTVAPALSII